LRSRAVATVSRTALRSKNPGRAEMTTRVAERIHPRLGSAHAGSEAI
jgi:hypothetical protein